MLKFSRHLKLPQSTSTCLCTIRFGHDHSEVSHGSVGVAEPRAVETKEDGGRLDLCRPLADSDAGRWHRWTCTTQNKPQNTNDPFVPRFVFEDVPVFANGVVFSHF